MCADVCGVSMARENLKNVGTREGGKVYVIGRAVGMVVTEGRRMEGREGREK